MSTPLDDFNAAMERLHGLNRAGLLTTWPGARSVRTAMKDVLRAMRRLLAAEPDPEIRRLRREQLRCLKRVHHRMLELEAIAIAEASRNN